MSRYRVIEFPYHDDSDSYSEADQIVDSDEERDISDQGPPSDFESEEDTQMHHEDHLS